MKKHVWRMCTSKNRYKDEHTANWYRQKYENERGKKLDYYWCPCCKGFHLTSVVYEVPWEKYEIGSEVSVTVG